MQYRSDTVLMLLQYYMPVTELFGNRTVSGQNIFGCVVDLELASFPGPKRRRRKGLVSAVCACANRGGIPPPLHTIDILPYACDARNRY